MLEQEQKKTPEKLIIWLNGGPGCSSMDGLFLENGPFRVNKNLTLSVNPGGWQNYATNIYLDQPVGTGFSFAKPDNFMHNMTEITQEFTEFIDQLFSLFPRLQPQDLYIAGESFAGSYIPYFAKSLLDLNKIEKRYNLKGIAIGNGWISPKHQYNAYYDFGVQHSLVEKDRMGITTNHLKACQKDLEKGETIHVSSCERVLSDITDSNVRENEEGKMVCMNLYDIRMKDEPYPECGLSWPYELPDVTKYLRLDEVKKAIHAEKQVLGWKECNSAVSLALNGDKSIPADRFLPEILEEIPVLLYNGEYDLICNTLGTEYLIGNMTWSGSKGFKIGTTKEDWKIDNELVGYYIRDRNLTYVLIKDGSHMVPYDKPIECLDMINRFIGSGHSTVKGKHSQVGKNQEEDQLEEDKKEDKQEEKQEEKTKQKKPHEDSNEQPNTAEADQEESKIEKNSKNWSKYSSWGTGALAVVSVIALVLACSWFTGTRRLSPTAEFGGAPRQEREGSQKPGLLTSFKNLFKCRKKQKNFPLEYQDDTNELDELVVETPTLFEAEESEEENGLHLNKKQHEDHLSMGDEEESDFDDFSDWGDSSTLIKTNLR
ncbi:unnamed protein product [Rhizopus stolonifer]